MLMTSLILSICSTVQPQYVAACKASLESGTKQYGLYQKVNNGEKVIDNIVTNDAKDNFGTTAVMTAGGAFFVGQSVQKKAVNFNLPTMGLCDSITNRVGLGSYTIRLGWRF